ncbi:MAG: ferritin-like domain-containing protein [Saccharospirillaceae bacterium]|nr:ferritin-like domain-containing protein [Pseudomonadales bacterium]NRB80417.1 ferritin-like domain-containing protein [Saccharospirillaceae bacterium]
MTLECFDLELLGGKTEQRYRAMRPDVEAFNWGSIDTSKFSPTLINAAKQAWSRAALQEYRTGAACCKTLQVLIQARAPIDLIALLSRFITDEIVHSELCARLANEFGSDIEIGYNPDELTDNIGEGCPPILHAAHLVVATFCIGEAMSIPLLHNTSKMSTQPLIKQVLRRIVEDEADHGAFGWAYLDWANHHLSDTDRAELAITADRYINGVYQTWKNIEKQKGTTAEQAHALGWLEVSEYLSIARRTLKKQVIAPLILRGVFVKATEQNSTKGEQTSPNSPRVMPE